SEQYLRKIGGLILVAAIIIWFLSYYPRPVESIVTPTMTEQEAAMAHSENSYLGRIGKVCEPVMKPLGLDWRASVALVSGAAAKEIVVSTLGVLYSVEDAEENGASLSQHLISSGNYSRSSALAMMIFVLLYFPCIATIAAIAQEAGGWRWALFSVIYNTLLAWVVAWGAYNIGILLGM
ncbi:MAG: ferrous iron transporter B, partial [Alistipes sp.]|nr:ferrous iron transporter B [Alistipes sp.]